MYMRKFITIALLFALATSACFAGYNGQEAVPVKLTNAAMPFSVTVPTSLPVNIAADGSVTCATNAKIINLSRGQVKLVSIAVSGANSWTQVAWNDAGLKTEKVNSKKFMLKLLSQDSLSNTYETSGIVLSADGLSSDEYAITYDAKAATQGSAVGETIANAVVTVSWSDAITLTYESSETYDTVMMPVSETNAIRLKKISDDAQRVLDAFDIGCKTTVFVQWQDNGDGGGFWYPAKYITTQYSKTQLAEGLYQVYAAQLQPDGHTTDENGNFVITSDHQGQCFAFIVLQDINYGGLQLTRGVWVPTELPSEIGQAYNGQIDHALFEMGVSFESVNTYEILQYRNW